MNYEMSADKRTTEVVDTCCASCGKEEVDDVKMKPCDGCDLVRYCSDTCKEDHRSEHEVKCKERAAELRDEILFKQPESTHHGDCPLCCVPLSLEDGKRVLYPCCSKVICNGCSYADNARQWEQKGQQPTCPFCRHPVPETREEFYKIGMKRVAANDPAAMRQMGAKHFRKGEYDSSFKYWTKAAELGDAVAHYNISAMYRNGQGVEKDETKKIFHLEEAAIRGHPQARHILGRYVVKKDNFDRAVKHWIIAASIGDDHSITALKGCYKHGFVSKEVFAAALRAHHAAVNATKSPQREAAARAIAGKTGEVL